MVERGTESAALLPEEIAAALASGAAVLTGNQRAARTLRRQFDLSNRARGLTRWEPPAIVAWHPWTASLWEHLLLHGHTDRLLLNRAQEHSLWRSIVAADPESGGMRTADSLADLAADAWSRLAAYQGEDRVRRGGVSADTRAFARWAKIFTDRCRSGGYLSAAQLEGLLAVEVAANHLSLAAGGYLLVGFDGLTPSQGTLVAALRAAGKPIEELPLAPTRNQGTVVVAEDERDEMATVARLIRQHIESNSNARLALVVPDLERERPAIDRVLRQTLSPEAADLAVSQSEPLFEFSLGVPLDQTPLVAAALDLLRWTIAPLPLQRMSALLLSPHFAGGDDTGARAAFDAYEFRRAPMLRPEISIDSMLRAAESSRRANRLPGLLGALREMRRAIAAEGVHLGESRLAADWADAMRAVLEASGWTRATDNSIEFQTRRKWESVLDELATLDFEGIRLTFADALASVERLAEKTLFAPESRNAPLQVMGPGESAGSSFDALWFLRAGDLSWPSPGASSPLLSWQLQRELGMPGVDAAADGVRARRIAERIAASAGSLVFSYAKETAAGTQRAASVLAHLDLQEAVGRNLLPPQRASTSITLEAIDDSTTLPPLPDCVVHGGANVLRLQAACGFRAFAEQRLWATPLDAGEPGMDARERGSAVHIALEHFWREVGSQAALKALLPGDRRVILARAVAAALSKPQKLSTSNWDAAYLEVQSERLMMLLDAWLLSEIDRKVPFTVKLQEIERNDVRIGPLRLTLRVDRVDETEFGDVILDYKTGAAKPAAWLSDRPDEPQLPLYAVLADTTELAGVAYAQVRPGKDRLLQGYQTQPGILPKEVKLKAASLEAQVEEWRRILTDLATQFYEGDVRVRPKSYPVTCEFCSQRILCRLDISLLGADATEDEEGEDEGG